MSSVPVSPKGPEVRDLAVDDHGGFQGGCRQFVVYTDETIDVAGRTARRGGYPLHHWLKHWEPIRKWVDWPVSGGPDQDGGDDDGKA
jgi:hypothetical protein